MNFIGWAYVIIGMAFVHFSDGSKWFGGAGSVCMKTAKSASVPCTVSNLNKETNCFETVHYHIPEGSDISGTNMGWRYQKAKREEETFTESS